MLSVFAYLNVSLYVFVSHSPNLNYFGPKTAIKVYTGLRFVIRCFTYYVLQLKYSKRPNDLTPTFNLISYYHPSPLHQHSYLFIMQRSFFKT